MFKLALFLTGLLAVCCHAKLAEKISEDEDFVVYRIPVTALDLTPQETGYGFEEPSYGRSSSKSVSHSKSSSQSTGSGKGRGFGGGSSGHGYGTGGGGHHGGYGGGSYQSGPSSFGGHEGGQSAHTYYRGGPGGYQGGSYDNTYSHNTNHYDDDHADGPKVFTTTKSYTNTQNNYQGTSATPVGELNYRLSDYVKDAPGHEHSTRYNQKLFQGFGGGDYMGSAPGSYRSEPHSFNVNEFTRTLNHGGGALSSFVSSGRNHFGNYGSPSRAFPKAYALRHSGFGLF